MSNRMKSETLKPSMSARARARYDHNVIHLLFYYYSILICIRVYWPFIRIVCGDRIYSRSYNTRRLRFISLLPLAAYGNRKKKKYKLKWNKNISRVCMNIMSRGKLSQQVNPANVNTRSRVSTSPNTSPPRSLCDAAATIRPEILQHAESTH